MPHKTPLKFKPVACAFGLGCFLPKAISSSAKIIEVSGLENRKALCDVSTKSVYPNRISLGRVFPDGVKRIEIGLPALMQVK
jgi:hypothetical protein